MSRLAENHDDTQAKLEDENDSDKSDFNTSTSLSDKEEIRRRLAFEIDDDDPIAQYRTIEQLSRKSRKSLAARMQNVDSLRLCFLNESDTNLRDLGKVRESRIVLESYTFDDLNNHMSVENNNDILMQNRIYYLKRKLQQENFDLGKINLFSEIEKPSDKSKFSEYHSKLYTEAKLTLSQIKEICKLRSKEKENEKDTEPSIYDLLIHNLPSDFQKNSSKFTRPILQKLKIAELQLIVNDMFSTIEKLNSSLVKMLINRDELYMEQDSLLVDIEDLTKFLLSK